MLKRKDKWEEEMMKGQAKTQEIAANANTIVKKTTKVSIKKKVPEVTVGKKTARRTRKKPTLQNVSKKVQRDSPTIIISYKNGTGNDVSEVYTCSNIVIAKDTVTTLDGEANTTRKDVVNINIEARVIGIDQ